VVTAAAVRSAASSSRDYLSAIEGVPIRCLNQQINEVPAYMNVGVAALKKALPRTVKVA
jgi:hypothetical protein